MQQPELRKRLLSSAYSQAVSEYRCWETYKREQWLAFLKYGEEDVLDLSLALLSGARRYRYPIAALDLAAYTLLKFGLDVPLATTLITGYVPNQRTGDEDPSQFLTLAIRLNGSSECRVHFSPHLSARCGILSEAGPEAYIATLLSTAGVSRELLPFIQRELARIQSGACPYEAEAERLFAYDADGTRRAEHFLCQGKWPPAEMRTEIEAEKTLLEGLRRIRDEDRHRSSKFSKPPS